MGRLRQGGRCRQHGRLEEADDGGGSDAARRRSPSAAESPPVEVHPGRKRGRDVIVVDADKRCDVTTITWHERLVVFFLDLATWS